MDTNKSGRSKLKTEFSAGHVPSQKDFDLLIDSQLNTVDDKISRVYVPKSDSYLAVGTGDQGGLICFYGKNGSSHPTWFIHMNEDKGDLQISSGKSGTVLFLGTDGKIGIHTSKPAAELDVNGKVVADNISVSEDLNVHDNLTVGGVGYFNKIVLKGIPLNHEGKNGMEKPSGPGSDSKNEQGNHHGLLEKISNLLKNAPDKLENLKDLLEHPSDILDHLPQLFQHSPDSIKNLSDLLKHDPETLQNLPHVLDHYAELRKKYEGTGVDLPNSGNGGSGQSGSGSSSSDSNEDSSLRIGEGLTKQGQLDLSGSWTTLAASTLKAQMYKLSAFYLDGQSMALINATAVNVKGDYSKSAIHITSSYDGDIGAKLNLRWKEEQKNDGEEISLQIRTRGNIKYKRAKIYYEISNILPQSFVEAIDNLAK